MKNIFVPTDFSDCATHAVNTALDLAEYYGATLYLYSNLDIREDWQTLTAAQKDQYPEDKQRIKNAQILFSEWERKAREKELSILTIWSVGKLIENIKEHVKRYAIDFIVMGAHGISGKSEYFIGSNTQRVVRTVRCPVFIVKNDIRDIALKKVIFASNFDESEKKAFQYLLDFIKPFSKTEIHLVEINTSSWFDQPYTLVREAMKDFKEMCGERKCFLHFYRDWSVDAGVRHFSEKIGANMIAISNEKKHPIKRIFVGSNVEAIVNHANLPVLSIDFLT